MKHRIIAIVVTCQPDPAVLTLLLTSVIRQVEEIILVDNGSATDPSDLQVTQANAKQITVLCLHENTGVAAAQNTGLDEAFRRGATHVLLLDHDSVPAPDMVEKLLQASEDLIRQGLKIAAVGPRYRFPDTHHYSYFVRFGWLKFKKIYCSGDTDQALIWTDFLISSGCLISRAAIEAVGPMDEALFVDHVDTDWFLRAKAMGYAVFGICGASMAHNLGDSLFPFGFRKKKMLPIHSPQRLYYIFRNSFLLYRRAYAPGRWIVNDLVRLGLMFIFFSTRIHPRRTYMTMMARGVYDGVRGISGRYPC